LKYLLSALAVTLLLSSCGTSYTVPITGRKQKIDTSQYSDQTILTYSAKSYKETLSKLTESTNATNKAMVTRVGNKLATAVETYLKQNGFANDVKNYSWEFHLVKNSEANAWCMPGGKIVVYEGLLPYTQNETSLAIVLGHEIAHAVARHSQENMTKSSNTQLGANILSGIGGQILGSTASTIANQVISLGGSALISGYSRKMESEADYMGLIFAAMAGYDPSAAVSFWQRMAQAGSSSGGIFSDHPSDEKRIADIKAELPTAIKVYNQYKK